MSALGTLLLQTLTLWSTPVKVKCVPLLLPILSNLHPVFSNSWLQRRDVTWPFFLSFKGLSTGPWVQLLYHGLESSPRKKTCPKTCHLRVLIPLKHEWNYIPPLLKTISPVVKVLVFTVALQLPVNFLSVSSFSPTSLLYSALLPSSPLLTQPYSSTSHVSFPLLHFSNCLGAPSHKLQAQSCLRAFAHVPFFPRHPNGSYLPFLQLSLQMSPNQRDLTPSTFVK